MKMRVPNCFDGFSCTNSSCLDNCCRTGWEIEIDNEAYDFYRTVGGKIGGDIRAAIRSDGDYACIVQKDGQCPLLNDKGLCRIVLELGEERLGSICAEHPRFYEWFDGVIESGVGICCEEAARLLYESKAPFALVEKECGEENDFEEYDSGLFDALYAVRERFFGILRDGSRSVEERLARLLVCSDFVQERIYSGDFAAISADCDIKLTAREKKDCAEVVDFYRSLEAVDGAWSEILSRGDKAAGDVPELFFEKTAEYLIYRYFLKAVFDEDVLSKAKLTVSSCLVLGAVSSQGNFAGAARQFSKNVEYSADNMDALAEESYENPAFGTDSLLAMLGFER